MEIKENIDILKESPIYWAANIKALDCFITKENINKLLLDNGIDEIEFYLLT